MRAQEVRPQDLHVALIIPDHDNFFSHINTDRQAVVMRAHEVRPQDLHVALIIPDHDNFYSRINTDTQAMVRRAFEVRPQDLHIALIIQIKTTALILTRICRQWYRVHLSSNPMSSMPCCCPWYS